MKQEFIGFIKKIKYEGQDGFYILEVENKEKEEYILKGTSQNIRVNDYFKAEGNWVYNKGIPTFESEIIEVIQPTETETILEYLSSGIIKGIGKATAKRIVEKFGAESLNIIDKKPDQLSLVPKLGQKTITRIINSWNEVKPSKQIVSELVRLGFKNFEAVRIYRVYGEDSINLLENYPYNICSKIDIEFKIVDFIVLKMGFPVNSPVRIKGALNNFMYEIQQNGNCILDKTEVLKLTYNYLKKDSIEIETIDQALQEGINKGQFHEILLDNGEEYIQTERMFNFENELSKRIYHLKNNTEVEIKKVNEIEHIEQNIKFTKEQDNAILTALNNKISVITGKPGVGKTTVLNEIINQFEKLDKKVLLCAPTGRAAQKMSESTNKPASTIHRLLKFNPMGNDFTMDEENQLECDVIFIDEASMIDIYLMVSLLRAIPLQTQIVIIGDVGQLPSVSAGSVLRDIIDSECIEVARIEQIQRQKGTSSIILNSHNIDKGIFDFNTVYDKKELQDFYFLQTDTDEETLKKIKVIINNRIEKTFNFDNSKDLQILSATHEGTLGTKNLNVILQNMLNKEEGYTIKKGDFVYKKNDKIIQTVNNYEKQVFNGDTGTIKLINENGIYVEFDNDKHCEYNLKEMEEILPSYTITGHKSQGSEYPVVIIPIPQIYTQVIDRSWLYTTITRGKSLVILVGSKDIFKRGIESTKSRNRKTYLNERIIEKFAYY